jgi:hypothetical protein
MPSLPRWLRVLRLPWRWWPATRASGTAALRTAIRSLIDIRGFFFDLRLQPKYEEIAFDLWLDTQETDARIKALADETDRRCPQLGLFRLARIPLLMRWHREGAGLAHEARFGLGAGETPDQRLRREKIGQGAANGLSDIRPLFSLD